MKIIESIQFWFGAMIGLSLGAAGLFLWSYPFVVLFIVIKNRIWNVLILLFPLVCIQGYLVYQIINEIILGHDDTVIGMIGTGFSILPCAVGFFVQLYLKNKKKQETV